MSPVNRASAGYPDTIELTAGRFAMLAPAKINLTLRVLGRRRDGYHELDTVFQEISLADRLEFGSSLEWRLDIEGADLDAGEDNLVTRAARGLSAASGVPCRAHVILRKEIPVDGGLGGGSSDAAVALIGLSRLWGLNWTRARLHELAAELGSDCAFFLYGGLARGRGRGEVLSLDEGSVPGHVVLVVPPFGVSTAWAYAEGRFGLTDEQKSGIFNIRAEHATGAVWPDGVPSNDLENIVLARYDELGRVKRRLLECGASAALLSGSGSAVYAVFEERSRAMHAAQQHGAPYRTYLCHAVSRARAAHDG